MNLNYRVCLVSTTGRELRWLHRAAAEGMLLSGQANYDGPGTIRVSNAARTTPEMMRGPITHGPRVRRADSSHGDAGRGWARGDRFLHIGIGHSNAGLRAR